ncbi:TetR/AcrR family transcriptional regulator [Sphingobium mellinum]|uniref:TetR/AcrR family transcriptional regulator n=1 Tax=Sphingobium mellinum TaxID=1387166 RepID=UPI0030EF6048
MTKTTTAISRRDERIRQRRAQILNAARACVINEGFHAATISRIGAVAAMSKGHIYKYYENKEEIMIALVEHHMHEFNALISQVDQSEGRNVNSLVQSFANKLPAILASDRTILWLEVQAEAARNPKVKEMVKKSAANFRETIRKVIEPVLERQKEEELDFRVEMLLISMHGLGLKATIHSDPDFESLATAVEFAFGTSLSTASQSVPIRKAKAA